MTAKVMEGRSARVALSAGGWRRGRAAGGSAENHLIDAVPVQGGADDDAAPEIREGQKPRRGRAAATVAVTYAITVRAYHGFISPGLYGGIQPGILNNFKGKVEGAAGGLRVSLRWLPWASSWAGSSRTF